MDVIPRESLNDWVVMGELGLDASIRSAVGVLPAAMSASGEGKGLICPQANGGEAAFAGGSVIAPQHLMALINHLKGNQTISPPKSVLASDDLSGATSFPDMADVKGQDSVKRAIEIAVAGGHNLLMIGPPGSGKSMMAARMAGLLPAMTSREILETSMIKSVAGLLENGQLSAARPFRDPHHSASLAALVGGGAKAKPGEVSLAHGGILFLDELPEFNRSTLEALRQPIETGKAVIARAQAHVTYPARFQLVAAMNPCKCGYLGDETQACSRAPACGLDYQAKISGPLYDRIDLTVDVRAVSASDLTLPPPRENSADIRARVEAARARQIHRYDDLGAGISVNAEADGQILEQVTAVDAAGKALLDDAIQHFKLSARGYHRVLRVARTIADLADRESVTKADLAEALSYRRIVPQKVR